MPFRPEHSLLRVEESALSKIDTGSVENLFGMWSLFSKASNAMEDGKRLENLSWRLWNRETFCCAPESRAEARSAPSYRRTLACPSPSSANKAQSGAATSVPALSSSLESDSTIDSTDDEDVDMDGDATPSPVVSRITTTSRPRLSRNRSSESAMSRGREKHITSVDLEKIVISIKESKLEPIDLPLSCPADLPSTSASRVLSKLDLTSQSSDRPHSATPHPSESHSTLLESSASTAATDSHASYSSHTVGSQESSSTEMSTHSIVRGFVPGGAPSSYRSQTNLATQPTPILKTSPTYRQMPPKKKGAMFTIGTSSGEEESSLESHMYKSQLSESLKRPGSLHSDNSKKQTSFKDEVSVGKVARHSPVFESDDEDEEVSESAIEDDDDSSDWEDSDDGSGPSSVNEKDMFQRVDSRPDLTSRRSLLTTLMHEPDRAKALQNAASRSTPAIRRSKTSALNGPLAPPSPDTHAPVPVQGQEIPRSKPIIMTTSNTHQQLALSPRTTRRNMLSTELTESLRKNLLWERQHRSTGNLAALKRRHTSNDVKKLKQYPEPGPVLTQQRGRFTNDYFDAGLGEYHQKGW